jgi:hypothetical protein
MKLCVECKLIEVINKDYCDIRCMNIAMSRRHSDKQKAEHDILWKKMQDECSHKVSYRVQHMSRKIGDNEFEWDLYCYNCDLKVGVTSDCEYQTTYEIEHWIEPDL